MNRILADRDGVGSLAYLQHHIQPKGAIGVEHDSGAAVGFEAGMVHFENVAADGKNWESISAPAVGRGGLQDAGARVGQSDGRFGNRGARRVFNCARNAATHASEGCP